MEVPRGLEPLTILTSRDALSGAEYKPDALPIELRDRKALARFHEKYCKEHENCSVGFWFWYDRLWLFRHRIVRQPGIGLYCG
jgi:hypothetical protein